MNDGKKNTLEWCTIRITEKTFHEDKRSQKSSYKDRRYTSPLKMYWRVVLSSVLLFAKSPRVILYSNSPHCFIFFHFPCWNSLEFVTEVFYISFFSLSVLRIFEAIFLKTFPFLSAIILSVSLVFVWPVLEDSFLSYPTDRYLGCKLRNRQKLDSNCYLKYNKEVRLYHHLKYNKEVPPNWPIGVRRSYKTYAVWPFSGGFSIYFIFIFLFMFWKSHSSSCPNPFGYRKFQKIAR